MPSERLICTDCGRSGEGWAESCGADESDSRGGCEVVDYEPDSFLDRLVNRGLERKDAGNQSQFWLHHLGFLFQLALKSPLFPAASIG